MKGLRSLAATTLALFLVFSLMGNSSSAPQRLLERRNWTPQAMLYLKGARTFQMLCSPVGDAWVHGLDGELRGGDNIKFVTFLIGSLYIFVSPERRSPNARLLTLPEAAALLLASLQKPREAGEENLDPTRFLDDSLLNW
ncbi:PREDICTED: spexin [Myotis davidii]|uniref:spexin n=1 Tax=Myotis davidii TaxID=225400 RepID=UPI0007674F6C|nr:PREDICTED: spexin [Myotis davidii]